MLGYRVSNLVSPSLCLTSEPITSGAVRVRSASSARHGGSNGRHFDCVLQGLWGGAIDLRTAVRVRSRNTECARRRFAVHVVHLGSEHGSPTHSPYHQQPSVIPATTYLALDGAKLDVRLLSTVCAVADAGGNRASPHRRFPCPFKGRAGKEKTSYWVLNMKSDEECYKTHRDHCRDRQDD